MYIVGGILQLFHIAAGDDQIRPLLGKGGGNAVADRAAAAILQGGAACAGDQNSFTR